MLGGKSQYLNIYSCSAPTSTALLSSIKTDEFFMGTIFCNLTLNIVSQKEFLLNVFKTLHWLAFYQTLFA